jgi:ATP-dependent protease ClpP protease subunit
MSSNSFHTKLGVNLMSKNNSNENKVTEEIKEFGSVTAFSGKHKIYCLTVIGEIEGHNVLPEQTKTTKYEHIIPQLVAVEESKEIEGLLVILNTVGGDVEAGLAIAELISGMKKPTVSFVLGGGHSIGVPLAVSAKRSFIAPSATMTVHPVRSNGLFIGVPQMFNHFARMQERITNFVSRNSGITEERFTELMMKTGEMVTDVGSVLSGENAVKEGLIDEIGTLNRVIEGLYDLIENNA